MSTANPGGEAVSPSVSSGPAPGTSGPDSNPRLLIVEDDRAAHDALRRILSRKGFQVVSAWTVTEALASLREVPNCIILDLMLPDGDGVTVLRKIRDEHLPIRVVIVSGVSDPDWLSEVARWHPDALLSKPIDLASLLAILSASA